jgi:hypothetical protein
MEAQTSFNPNTQFQGKTTVARSERVISQNPLQDNNIQFNSDLILLPTSLIAIGGIVSIILGLNLKKNVRNRFSALQRVKQMPCANCRYFKNNPYLKCAVQPDKVLTQDAHNCSDYQSH